MNKKLAVFSLLILISISIVFAFTFGDVLSGKISLVDIISGKAIKGTTSTCKDSDGGLNYNVLGNVTRCSGNYCKVSQDSCYGMGIWTRLSEKYCKGSNVATKSYKCPNGCSNGACVNIICTDSDGGDNYYLKGTVSGKYINGSSFSNTDVCVTNYSLSEYYCKSGYGIGVWGIPCPNGCKDGACISLSTNQTISNQSSNLTR